MQDWLVFDSEAAAKSAVNQIDVKLRVPIKGRRPDGTERPGAVGTETWATPMQRLTDGKWAFQRCPDADPSRPFAVEPYDVSWFPGPTGS